MTVGDIDLFEVNEAFAAVPMVFMEHFGVDHSRVNVTGGSIALGHPLGATAWRYRGRLDAGGAGRRNGDHAGIGGGMGIATIIERV